jgi:DNA repair protein RadC
MPAPQAFHLPELLFCLTHPLAGELFIIHFSHFKSCIMKSTLIPSETFLVSEIELSYNPKVKLSERMQIDTPADSYKIFYQNWDSNKIQFVEQFKVMFLNNANRVLGIYEVSTGGTTSTVVDVRLVFGAALLANTSKIILSHNHPSGSLRPSQPDFMVTRKLKDAGKLLDIVVADHLIVSNEGYYSFGEEGVL